MRISYWSSDECSSALSPSHPRPPWPPWPRTERGRQMAPQGGAGRVQWLQRSVGLAIVGTAALGASALWLAVAAGAPERSEEHTSELQSLMRISYAVFCLKKKTKTSKQTKLQEQ